MLIFIRVYDFIKSWLYYPKMIQYLRKCGINEFKRTKFQYALWHCRTGNLSDIGYENCKTQLSDVADDWKNVYGREPIEK